jgi:16S rRNA (guanine527-N7)-methyltransferase
MSQKPDINDAQIAAALLPYGVQLSNDQSLKLRSYITILLKWNKLISLTTIVDPTDIVARHFGESMFLRSILPVENCRLADVGAGGGFPGIPLKILCESVHLTLIESNKKKCAFLSEIIRSLDLKEIDVLPQRFEEIRPEPSFAEIVTARAVGGFPALLKWSRMVLAPRGHIALWVGGEDTTKISNTPGWTWQPAVRLPDSQRRFILIGRPQIGN